MEQVIKMEFEQEEFEYLKEHTEDSSQPEHVPEISGATPLDKRSNELDKKEESSEEEPEEEIKPENKTLIFVVKVTTNKEDKAFEMVAEKAKG